MDTTEKGALLW